MNYKSKYLKYKKKYIQFKNQYGGDNFKDFLQAIQLNDYNKVKELIDTNNFYKKKDNNGITPLMYASGKGNINIVILLLVKGSTCSNTPLSKLDECEIKIELLKNIYTVCINEKDSDGRTALIYASTMNHFEIVRLLLYKGADVNISNNNQDTALMCALMMNNLDIVRLLLDTGADFNAKNNKDVTVLMVSLTNSTKCADTYLEIFTLLLNRGADPNACTQTGMTTLMMASEKGLLKVVELLLSKKVNVNVNVKSNNDETALKLASEQGHTQIVQLLKDNGAY